MKLINDINNLPNKCLFFGYGSLMYYSGINGRGLKHVYKSNDELIPYNVKGLKRSMSAEIMLKKGILYRFYSIERNKNNNVFGMLFKIHSLYDLKALLFNESANPVTPYSPLYNALDISDKVESDLPVITLEAKELPDNKKLYYPLYVETVYKNIPNQYKDSFLNSGGLSCST
jgi:hypothetical protein